MSGLIHYRLDSPDWADKYLEEMGIAAFLSFETRVNNALDKLGINRYYNITESVIPSQQELFIKFCCLYIERHPEYEFNDNYTQIWRKESYEQWKMETRRRNLHSRTCR